MVQLNNKSASPFAIPKKCWKNFNKGAPCLREVSYEVANYYSAGYERALGHFLRSLSSNVRKNNWYRFIISPEWIYKECEAIIHS